MNLEQVEGLQQGILWFLLGLSVLTFLGTLFKTNAYGRHMQGSEKFTLPALPAWLLFECPQWWSFALTFWGLTWYFSDVAPSITAILLFTLWQSHYLYRSIIYPLRMRDRAKRFPLSGVVFGFAFNAVNGFVNGFAVLTAAHLFGSDWLSDPRFIAGLLIAASGWWINFKADGILINLRQPGETGYKIPQGGMFKYVSSANYFGEIVLWCGWALMCFTPAGLVFALFTIANLLPRALSHHRWYREKFPDYPAERKAIIPGVL
ncbi:MAG: 3-oxo-5-alpha-steroid 4-dehydrogenase [Nevskiales bacterium]